MSLNVARSNRLLMRDQARRPVRWSLKLARERRARRAEAKAAVEAEPSLSLTAREHAVYAALARAGNGLSAADLLPLVYAGRRVPASAIDCVRSCVAQVRRKIEPRGLTVPCVGGRYRLVRGV